MFLVEVQKNDWWGLGHAQFDCEALLVITNLLSLWVSLACDYYHRVLLAQQGGEHIDD